MKPLSSTQKESLLHILRNRFEQHPDRHPGISWKQVAAQLEAQPQKLAALQQMEATGGEPDVVDLGTGTITFADCCVESPAGRRSLCYDRRAWTERKENRPADNVLDTAGRMGIQLLSEAQYRRLQEQVPCDHKTSSWIQTPDAIRQLGGALFGDRRYGQVFTYHNGASSYYAARGFRGMMEL
ncbi:MAG TPA: DUF4256 domain-containing protein [Lacibacter sp.]|nr:DUF4256 domain-containing protein [Lacibacter sp.]HMO88838.1 DUF4256 domain-containing protein [Lacibacter sp.]HMP88110.1 DUF4256 domain-containing protein [Lacibacter sp.]